MKTANKKIRNATVCKDSSITFKSVIEKRFYNILLQHGFNPRYEPKTFTLWEGFQPITPYYDKETDGQFELNFNGNMYYPVRNELYDNFDNLDTRKQGTLKAVFTMDAPHDYVGCFPYKYRGTTPSGASERLFADDFPV